MRMETLERCPLCAGADIHPADPAGRLAACRACGAVFDSPRPVLDEIVEFYSKPGQYDAWVAEGGARDLLWRRRLGKLRRRARPGSLLDIGAGIGQFLHHASRHFGPVEGTEVSASAIAHAKARFGLELRHGTVETLDFGGRRFDNVTLFHVLEHVPSPRDLLAVCRERLVPGGMLFIAVPNDIASLGAVKRRLLRRLGRGGSRGAYGLPPISLDGTMDEIHLTHFTPPVLGRFLEGMGFAVEELSLDPFYAASGARLLGHHALHALCAGVLALTGRNVYGTIWAAARRRD